MATGGVYRPGELVRVTATFTVGGVATDPTAVQCIVVDPQGSRTVYTYGVDAALAKDGTGVYHVDLSPTVAKTWTYAFKSTGTGQGAAEATFTVKESKAL